MSRRCGDGVNVTDQPKDVTVTGPDTTGRVFTSGGEPRGDIHAAPSSLGRTRRRERGDLLHARETERHGLDLWLYLRDVP